MAYKDLLKGRFESLEKDLLAKGVLLVVVSKGQPQESVLALYDAGARHFGENRAQALFERFDALPRDIHWHMIGHLQSNKVKYVAPFVHRIHSVDSWELLAHINKAAKTHNRLIRCLLQVRIAKEEAKYGLNPEEALAILSSKTLQTLSYVSITGFMGMATYTADASVVLGEFAHLASLFNQVKAAPYAPREWKELSMGMSGDYHLALRAGANVLRIGRTIFDQKKTA